MFRVDPDVVVVVVVVVVVAAAAVVAAVVVAVVVCDGGGGGVDTAVDVLLQLPFHVLDVLPEFLNKQRNKTKTKAGVTSLLGVRELK